MSRGEGQERGEIGGEVGSINNTLDYLEDVVATLEDRLHPILHDLPTTGKSQEKVEEKRSSSLGETLYQQHKRVSKATQQLVSINERIAL